MQKLPALVFSLLLIQAVSTAQTNPPQLLLRLDDNGMNHSVTMAIQQVAETGILFSTSVMFACPWYQEAVTVLKKYPQLSIGVHLTLNSEWKHYRWGPVLGRSAVPSLVDSNGYFFPSTAEFLKSGYKLEEVEKELSAQIERAVHSGLQIDYVDYHMGTATSTPELRAIVEKLATKYKLGISRYFGENYQTMFGVSIETKQDDFLKQVAQLPKDKVNLMVMHVAEATPEMNALVDMNNKDQYSEAKPLVAMHRSAELKTLLSKQFQDMVKNGKVKLVTYRDLVKRDGLERMRAPAN
jgi:chitin disaccharide deacetylase